MADLHALPSVEQLLQTHYATELMASYGRPLTLQAIRTVLERVRSALTGSVPAALPATDGLLAQAQDCLKAWAAPTLVPVINASGVILHTNLGRAPLSAAAIQAMDAASRSYSNLEYDLATGKRGARLLHAEALLQNLTGAEAALAVNNNAAAVLLALTALSARKRAVISRTQLIEIGGGFRLPDVMKQSGARLVEVGATNRVHLADYEQALTEPAAVVLHAHHSNFKIIGFTEEPGFQELAQMAHAHGALVIDDLGSGALLDTAAFGLAHEPTVQESLAAGADLVCFSGDKLLGGPQAGLIVGRRALIEKIKKHPLARALRADKVRLAGLMATLLHYLKDEAVREIPIWRMIALPAESLQARAQAWAEKLGQGQVIASRSTVGGGSLPGESLPTFVLALTPGSPDRMMAALRRQQPPVIARTERDQVLLDPRTVVPEQEDALLVNLLNVLQEKKNNATQKRT